MHTIVIVDNEPFELATLQRMLEDDAYRFGAVIVGLALAAALDFGLGGREEAAKTIASWRSRS